MSIAIITAAYRKASTNGAEEGMGAQQRKPERERERERERESERGRAEARK
jgi:hypothetical protein